MKRSIALPVLALLTVGSAAAHARPIAPGVVCDTYPASGICAAGPPPCTLCHVSSELPSVSWNAFGGALKGVLPDGLDETAFGVALPAALAEIAPEDSDGDGFSNGDEIAAGSFPGDYASHVDGATCPDDVTGLAYPICHYSRDFAYRKMKIDFCGVPPTYADVKSFAGLSAAEQEKTLDQELDACLKGEFWRGKNGAVWALAHRKIRPVGTFKLGEDPGQIGIADYYDDYALFVYTQIDGHDARDVLLAKYYVVRAGPPSIYTRSDAPVPNEPMDAAHRQGLMTTQWYLLYNVMFTPVPRTAAAQAYRAFLNLDIARQEGLHPVPGEPKDYDARGVTKPECEVCHSTLDPLTYPFKNYDGFQGPNAGYNPNRIEDNYADLAPHIEDMPEAGWILGQKVNDLGEWAAVAANSDEFAIATVGDYWQLLMGYAPTGADAEFKGLWKDFRGKQKWSVDAMLHAFVRTEAYGAP